jgi:hypothetical protein
VPFAAARPGRRPLVRAVAIGVVGLAVGIGATLAVDRLGGHPERAASVQRLDLPGPTDQGASGPDRGQSGRGRGRAASARPIPVGVGPERAAAPVRAGTARAAVRRFLEAGAAGDLATAYDLLDEAGRTRYPKLARWTRAQADRAEVTGVRVGGQRRAGPGQVDVTVTLSHQPAIDPFAGLVPARTVERWRASRQGGRWRVAAEPLSVRAELAGDDRAPAAVTGWVQRLLDCDRQGAAALQAGAELYGPADLAEAPCRRRGRWTVAAPQGFDAAVDPEAYVAAFGPEVAGWARLVPVQGPGTRFHVVVGPLGDGWRVLGTDPVERR